MIEKFIHTRGVRIIVAGSAILIGAAAFHYYLGRQGPSYKEVIVAFSALIGLVIIFGRELGVRFGFVLWVLTLVLGYRTVAVTSELAIHPSEVLLWLLLLCILTQRRLVSHARLAFPVWLWMFIPFWVLAWWPMIGGDARWDTMLNEFRNFLVLIPLIIVASVVLRREQYWRYLLLAFFLTGSCIALMGILEYWFPQVTAFFPAFISNAGPSLTEEGFARAQFSFWGGPMATFICVLALPSAIVLAKRWPRRSGRLAIAAGAVLQILAVYIGGYRSVWLILFIQVITACLLGLKKQGAIIAVICLLVSFGGYQLVPRTTERAISGIAALRGQPTDSSATGRQNRALGALSSAIDAPFGSGWSAAGWVHSDFLQVATNLGLLGGLIFLGGYFYTLLRLGRRVLPNLRAGRGELGFSLMLSFIAVGGLLAMEGVTVLPQMALPVWFFWGLSEVWLRQTADVLEESEAAATSRPYHLMPVGLASGIRNDA
jgi:hypothetical protein